VVKFTVANIAMKIIQDACPAFNDFEHARKHLRDLYGPLPSQEEVDALAMQLWYHQEQNRPPPGSGAW
jgi:hypothetical protein